MLQDGAIVVSSKINKNASNMLKLYKTDEIVKK